jgi:hypothetical protein
MMLAFLLNYYHIPVMNNLALGLAHLKIMLWLLIKTKCVGWDCLKLLNFKMSTCLR